MEDLFVEYLLNSLDDSGRREVEAYLERSPQARPKLEALKAALAPLEIDREPSAPPKDLVMRTLARVAEHACRSLPRSPEPMSQPVMVRPWWRRGDWLVAACLMIAIVGVGVPAIMEVRAKRAVMVGCHNNLSEFYRAVQNYHDVNNKFPDVQREAPNNVAGIVVPILRQKGVLPVSFDMHCPGDVMIPQSAQTLEELRALSPEEFAKVAPRLNPSYAYTLGYRTPEGIDNLSQNDPMSNLLPVMADRPLDEMQSSNSLNHGGKGQNVLFADGHVVFCTTPQVGVNGDHIYRNRENKVAAGVDPLDTVLGRSAARP